MADSDISLGIKITADGAGANAAIATLTKNLEKVGTSSKSAASEAERLAAKWRELSAAGQAQLKTGNLYAASLTAGMSQAGRAAEESARKLRDHASAARSGSESIKAYASSMMKLSAAYLSVSGAISAGKAVIEATRDFDRLRGMMDAASGSAMQSALNMRYVEQISKQLGMNVMATAESFASLTAAAKDTALEGKKAQDIFTAFSKAASALGKSSADTQGIMLALSQMISKGKVSMEELRQQLGERLPGAFQLAAKAMGVTTAELDKMVTSGQVTAEQLLPKLAKALDETYSGAKFDRINNQLERLDNAWTKLKATIVDNSALNGATKLLTYLLEKLTAVGEKANLAANYMGGLINAGTPNPTPTQDPVSPLSFTSETAGKAAKTYIEAANAAWKLNDAQKAVVETIVKIGEAQGFDPAFLLSIAKAETQLGNMKRLVSPTGAQGIFQFMPATAKAMGVKDPFNLEQATNGAIKYLGKLKNEFKSVNLAAAGYNAGEGAVRKYGGTVPPYKETQTYVRRVLQNMQDLQSAMGKSTDDIGKDIAKAEKDQYQTYADGLKQREKAYDDYSKVALAKNKTLMDELAIQQQAVSEKSTVAVSMGDIQSLKQAESEARQLILDRNKATVESIGIEEKAIQKRLGNIGMEIAAAKQLKQFNEVAKLESERGTDKANLQALAETRKQLEIQTNNDLLQNARQYAEKRLQLDKGLADANVAMAQERRQAEADALQLQYQAAEFSQSQLQANIEDQKAAIEATVAQTRAQIALNEEQRAQALEGKSGLEAIAQQRENINGKLRDALTLIQAEKQAALDKLNLDAQMLEYEQQIAEWKKTNAQDAVARLQAETAIADIHAQQAANAQKYLDVLAGVAVQESKARTEAASTTIKVDTQEVRESQLRMNAFWDQYMQRLTDYASLWQEITGETQNGFSRMTLAMGEYAKQTAQISQYFENNPNAFGDFTGAIEGIQQGQAALAAMAKTMLALRSNYKEGTQGYKDMTSAAERMMEVQQALQVVEGVLAVIHQLSSGDVYTAIPRALGVAAMIASLGIQTGASGSAGMSNSAAQQAARAGGSTAAGGGVFGDSSAQSDSIAKSLSIIAENSSVDLSYSAGMYRALKNIEAAMGGVTNSIIRGVGPAEIPGLGTKGLMGNSGKIGGAVLFGPVGYGLGVIGDAISKILFNVTKKITDWGIKALPQSFSDILSKGFQGMNFTEVTTTTKVLFMTVSKKVKEYTTDLNSEVGRQITLTILNMADAVKEAGKAFGISGDQFTEKMGSFVIDFGRFSTKGLKGQELKDAVGQMFSTMSDDMAQYFSTQFNLGLEPFQQAGEGMFETLMRVSNGINVASGLLEQAGLQAINYQQIILKQGDVAAEIVRQSIVKFEGIDTALGRYIDGAVGTAEDLMTVYDSLLQIREIAPFVALNFENLSNTMIVAAGGVSAFLKAVQTYQQEFRPGTALASEIMMLQSRMAKLGETMPNSRDGFIALVEGVDTSTESGQRLYAQLIKLAGAFDSVFDQIDNADELLKKYLPTDALSGFRDQIRQVGDDFKTIIASTLATLPGGAEFMSLSQQKKNVTENLITKQTNQASTWAKLDLVNEEIFVLQAKDKLSKEEKKELATLRGKRRTLTATLREVTADVAKYRAQLAKIDEKLAKNPGSAQLATKRAELIEKQGDALIKTISDIWDQMTQAINQAKETLKSIQDSIFELAGGMGGESIKYGMANARRIAAESAYQAYTGNDINQLNKLSSDYYRAIMDEYNAKMELIEAPKKALEKERELRQKAHDEEISALEKTLGKTQELNDAIKAIQKYALDLKLGSQSTLSPEQRLAEAQKQYAALLARAQGGDVNAMQELASGASSYLDAAQKYYGSNSQYATIFDGVQKAMESLGAMNPGDADSIQAKIDQLNKDHEIYLKSIDEQITALNIDQQIKDLQAATVAKLQLLADDLGPRITEAEKQAAEDMKILIAEIMSGNVFNERQLDTLREIAASMGITLPDYNGGGGTGGGTDPTPGTDIPKYDGPAAYKGWNAYWRQQLRTLKGHPEWGMTWAEYKAQEYNRLKSQGMHPVLPNFANGGFAQAGMALVGERGPEIVRFERPAQVMTADETREALSGSPKTFKALEDIKTELAALVTTQSGANPEIIKELRELRSRMDSIERTSRLKA